MTQYQPNPQYQPQPRLPDPGQPESGRSPKKSHKLRTFLILASAAFCMLVAVIVIAVAISTTSGPAKQSAEPTVVTTADNGPTPDPVTTPTNIPSVVPSPAKTTAPKPTKAAPKLTMSQEQAIGSAQDYLDGQSFSRKGLIEQLEYEGFSAKDATFGVDYLRVNWNEQAVEVAKNYLDTQHFSRSGLIEQLEYEGFTHKQAAYGVTKAGL